MFRTYRLAALLALALIVGVAVPGGASDKAGTIDGVVYFLLDDNGTETSPGPYLVAVHRTLDASLPATTAMQALLDGPTNQEKRKQGISSAIPARTKLRGISISGGVATVNLSGRFDNGGGSSSMQARLAQVVWTLTQFPTVDGVKFKINGTPTTVFGGEGVIVDSPSEPMDWEDLLPAILVTRPAFGGAAANPVRITGYARTFEATFIAQVETAGGHRLGRTVVTYGGVDSGEFGWFDITLPYRNHRVRNGIVKVWEASAQDGHPINVREYRVRLAPSG
jgi:hypothetical protein